MTTDPKVLAGRADAVKAARQAENGMAVCRCCKKESAYPEVISVNYGNGVLYTICPDCLNNGITLVVARTHRGLELKAISRNPHEVRG